MPVRTRKFIEDERIVMGEVYAPHVIDTHGEMMLHIDVRKMGHSWLLDNKGAMIDIMHNNKIVHAAPVESFIARKDDPEYAEGAWVLGTKLFDDDAWADCKSGKLGGYSVEAYVRKQDALVDLEITPLAFGVVEKSGGHDHYYSLKINDEGKVVGGMTSTDDGHYHVIRYGTATEEPSDKAVDFHQHRFFLV
jgi:hypothetical protein